MFDNVWNMKTRRWRLQNMSLLRSMMKMLDNFPKLPMTYRVSPDSCTVVIVAISTSVEYLPS